MTVLEIMERAGVTETGRAVAYIKDGLREVQHLIDDNQVSGTVASYKGTLTIAKVVEACTITSSDDLELIGFKAGMKLRISGSDLNDTDDIGQTTTSEDEVLGYFTIESVSGVTITTSGVDVLSSETSTENVTITGFSENYNDIIKNKRFYNFPSDMIKLKNIRIKNHDNTSGKYKSIPRLAVPPGEGEGDGI